MEHSITSKLFKDFNPLIKKHLFKFCKAEVNSISILPVSGMFEGIEN